MSANVTHIRWILLVAALASCERAADRSPGRAALPRTPGVRITMGALHAAGGVPVGWMLTPPPGSVDDGRQAFADLGCPTCHRVAGETFASPAEPPGPDLTGMGAHHPPAYFAEAILNPDAVRVDGPGYIDADGHSTMPDYPQLTIRELADLVAYLTSLTSGAPAPQAAGRAGADVTERPAPPVHEAKAFLMQTYDVRPGALEALQRWMQESGSARLRERGVVSIVTYVDFTRERNPYTTLFGFRDGSALQSYAQHPDAPALDREFDGFVSAHEHVQQMWAPIYRAPSLSAP